jgi:hypothetical protein
MLCRAQHSAKERARRAIVRAGGTNTVDPLAARIHLLMLSSVGVGRRSVSQACDVPERVLQRIRSGKRKYIRKVTEDKILAVTADAYSEGSFIDSKPTWKLIRELIREGGFTKAELARLLGLNKPELRWHKRIRGTTAVKVEKLYKRLMSGTVELRRAA